MSNRTLWIIFIVCLLLWLLGTWLRKDRGSSFDPVLMTVDTAKVDRIHFIHPDEEFRLERDGQVWQAVNGELKVPAQASMVEPILNLLPNLAAKRVVTDDPNKYPQYEITDEEASQLIVFQGKKEVANLYVGGFRFDQAARTASTFVRKKQGKSVYLIDGFAGMTLKGRFDQFRDKSLVKVNAADLTSVEWMDAAGRKEVIRKEDGAWHYAGMEAVDSTLMSNYLNALVGAQGPKFGDGNLIGNRAPIEQITLYGNDMIDPTVLGVYEVSDTLSPFLIHSSVNPDAYFLSDSVGLYKRIFADLHRFFPDGQ